MPNDSLPKNICKDCRYQLERSHYFRQLSKSCDLRLKKHTRLINQKKKSDILSKNYKDDDIEDLEEVYQESYVRNSFEVYFSDKQFFLPLEIF